MIRRRLPQAVRTGRASISTLAIVAWFCAAALLSAAQSPRPPEAPSPEDMAKLVEMLGARVNQMEEGAGGAQGRGEQTIDLAALKEKYQNCVVKIEFTMIANLQETKFNPTKSERYYSGDEPPHGTGFFIGESEIVTNAHVVEEARQGSIRVKSPATGNVEFEAQVIGVGGGESIDLAVLRLPEDELARFKKRAGLDSIPYLQFGDSSQVQQADAMAIFGYPEESDELKIIQCKVTGREYLRTGFDKFVCGHQFIEVGPAGVVQPGNSGGPALNTAGEVVGVPSRGNWGATQGWLIPSQVVVQFLDQVKNSAQGRKALEMPQLGAVFTENFPGTAVWDGASEDLVVFELGVVISDVIPGSQADDWGLKPNDIIVGFANARQSLSCAIDFKGYRVTTGKMKHWPPSESPAPAADEGPQPAKLHLNELFMMSRPGDSVALWHLRQGQALQVTTRTLECKPPLKLPHLGAFEKPDFELWGDFVAQEFNDYTRNLYEIPAEEVLKGGALITFVEPNSLASRRGMKINSRSPFGFAFMAGEQIATNWVVVESINGQPVKSLAELRAALRKAEQAFEAKKKEPGYDPAQKALMKERYVQIGFRANTTDGRVLRLRPGFPIDDALECRSVLKPSPAADG